MHHPINPADRFQHHGFVADVADQKFDVGVKFSGALAGGMDLLDQAVEDAHMVAALQKRLGEVAADKPGAAGDQDGFSHGRRTPPT